MIRELFIKIYLFLFRTIFNIAKLFPLRNKTVFVTSFGDNSEYVAEELDRRTNSKIIFLKTPGNRRDFTRFQHANELLFSPRHFRSFLWSIYHLATSSFIFVDNYYGFLAEIRFKKEVSCIQLWHAAGAVKKFGLEDPSIKTRSAAAKKRFQRVYDKFDYVVTGSDIMGDIYRQSFGLPENRILKTGIPRTDFFFDLEHMKQVKEKLQVDYSEFNGKKVLLYAPTFRERQLNSSDIALEIEVLYKNFHEDYVLLLRLHPAVTAHFQSEFEGFLYDVTKYEDINHLLVITDILITDYSSIPFEFALLKRPMIFFAYDLESYKKERGFWENYRIEMPGPVVQSTEGIVEEIKNGDSYQEEIEKFAAKWNKYSDGKSSEKLIRFLYNLS